MSDKIVNNFLAASFKLLLREIHSEFCLTRYIHIIDRHNRKFGLRNLDLSLSGYYILSFFDRKVRSGLPDPIFEI